MSYLYKACEECEEKPQGSSLRERIWETHLQNREIIINGEIDDSLIEMVCMVIMEMNRVDDANEAAILNYEREPIKLFLHSSGGEISPAFSLISCIKASKTPIWTIAMGKAYSAAFLILIAGDVRYAQLYSDAMYHQGASGMLGKFMDMYEYSDYLEKLDNKVQQFVLDHTFISKEDLEECHLRKVDWYMDTKEMIELGVIDGVYPPDVYTCMSDLEDGEDECEAGCTNECEDCK
jgi:ATP-dependent Clp protease, protease subunit